MDLPSFRSALGARVFSVSSGKTHRVNGAKATLIACLLISSGAACAQSSEKEPIAILELGGSVERSFDGSGWSSGPTVAAEVTPIENWLELEAGVTPNFSSHAKEWDTDLLFKKPWTLSKKAEIMAGVGPEWVHTRQAGTTTNSIAGEAALDLMFWPAARHRFGWYLEPAFDYNFGRGHERSLGVSGGLLIAIP